VSGAPSSRLTKARRRLRVARYAIAALAAAGFGGGIAAARASHPTTHAASTDDQAASSSLDFGGGSYIAPATSAPQVQSGGS
jgi:hypothetical protein